MILDCDPGIDDALAIILAIKARKFQIDGITTVWGNTTIENSTINTLKVLTLLQEEQIAVYRGVAKPLDRDPIYASGVHGKDGLAENNIGFPKMVPQDQFAVDFLISHILKNPNKITLITIGPLSNIAMSILQRAEICSKIKEIVIMGGAIFEPGNIRSHAEFNIFVDPEAAQVVLNSGIRNVILVPLDVTHKVILTPDLLDKIDKKWDFKGLTLPRFIHRIVNFSYKFYMMKKGFNGFPLHDPLAVGIAIDPSFVEMKPMKVKVITDKVLRGKTSAQFMQVNCKTESNSYVNVALKVESERFLKWLIDTINS
ncbi:MAG: nucleoside hydrolase [Candidatus Helarchaeota archaeon]